MRLIRSSQLLALAGLFAASGAFAATYTVSVGNDSGLGTLRQAITDANANPGADVINITVNTVTLTSALPQITQPVTISGLGARSTIVNGANGATVFNINSSSGTVLIEKLTIRGNGAGTVTGNGAGILAQGGGTINLSQVAVENNRATGSGGGLYTTGPTTISQSTFSGNSAANGGAVAVASGTSDAVTISNSTFSGNSATAVGAAFDVQTAATATIKFSTVAFNTVSVASNSIGAGLNVSGNNGGYSLIGSLLANNLTTSNDRNCGCSYSGCTFVSLGVNGVNIDTGNSCSFQSGNISNALSDSRVNGAIQALLTPTLADNGGQTNTHAIPAGSPAADYANHVECTALAVDQRGQARPTDSDASGAAQCEVGAFETQATSSVPIGGGGGSGGGGGGSGGGGGGGGCTLAPQSSDPLMPALALIGLAGLWYRSRSKR